MTLTDVTSQETPVKMGKAAVLPEFGSKFIIKEYPRPAASIGELVVEIEMATLCGSDVHAWKGDLNSSLGANPPLILGHEMTGRIIELGGGAEIDSMGQPLQIGDRVVWAHAACGRCRECTLENEPTLCANRYIAYLNDCSEPPHFTGSFAEYGIVRAAAARVRVPDSVKSSWASAASCALRTVIRALEIAGPIRNNDTVLIQGSGPLGLFATALASLHDPRQIVVVGGPASRLEVARKWGATHTINVAETDQEDRIAEVMEISGSGASVGLELAGAPGVVSEGVQMLARNARYVLMGSLGGAPQPIDVPRIITRGIRIRGSMSGAIGDYYSALKILERYRDRFDWDLLLGNTYKLTEISDAISAMTNLTEIKPIIVPAKTT